jgi:hypothetical protein
MMRQKCKMNVLEESRGENLRKRMGQKKQISYYQCVIPILVVGFIVLGYL